MPLVARVAHARLLLEPVKSSGEIAGQKWSFSDGSGFDGR
jgi:hypothetical protein